MSIGNCPTSGYFMENENGFVLPEKVANIKQIDQAMAAFEQTLHGSSEAACIDSLFELHRIINGAAEACLISDVDVYHKKTADILRRTKPSNQKVAGYIKRQLETFYVNF